MNGNDNARRIALLREEVEAEMRQYIASGRHYPRMWDLNLLLDTLDERDATIKRITTLLSELTDPDDCWFDHHGGCQAHGFLSLKPGETCPHADAKAIAAAHKTESENAETS